MYSEDLDILDRMLSPAEAFAVVMALNNYAMDGEMPEGLSAAQMIAFEMMRQKIDRAMQNYAAKSEKRSAAAKSRWDAKASSAMQTDAKNANASFAKQPMQMDGTITVTETVNVTETKTEGVVNTPAPAPATDNVIAFDGSDLTADIRNNQKAQELAARYLPRGRTPMEFDPRVGALAEDIGTHGAEKVEAALKEAARCDNRGGVSIAFYRTILGNLGKEKPPNKAAAGDYQHRQYTEADFRAMEVDLDAL